MIPVFLAATLGAQASPAKVAFQDGAFVVSGPLGSEIVAIQKPTPGEDPIDRKLGRFRTTVQGKTVTFDAKGLTVTQKKAVTSRLKSVPTSGKVATKESNAELMKLVAEGRRKLEVSALSGWELLGDDLYLLLRWDDSQKKPWFEALMVMDMSKPAPEARLVGKFSCLSFGQGPVDDVLVSKEGHFLIVGNGPDGLVLSRLSKDGARHDDKLGSSVSKAKFLPDVRTAWALTSTSYGTNVVGYFETDNPVLHTVSEFRGRMKGILEPAYAVFDTPTGLSMVNMLSGAIKAMPKDSDQRQTANGLLLWTPSVKPTRAELLDSSFRRLAEWSGTTETPTVPTVTAPTAKPATGAKPGAKKHPAKQPATKPPVKKPGTKGTATKTPTAKKPAAKKPKGATTKPKIEVSSKPSGRR